MRQDQNKPHGDDAGGGGPVAIFEQMRRRHAELPGGSAGPWSAAADAALRLEFKLTPPAA